MRLITLLLLLVFGVLALGDAGVDDYKRTQKEASREDILRQAQFSNNIARQTHVVQREEQLAMKIERSEAIKSKATTEEEAKKIGDAERKAQLSANKFLHDKTEELSDVQHKPTTAESAVQSSKPETVQAATEPSGDDASADEVKKEQDVKKRLAHMRNVAQEAYDDYVRNQKSAEVTDKKRQAEYEAEERREKLVVQRDHDAHERMLQQGMEQRKEWEVALEKEKERERGVHARWLAAFKLAKSRLEHDEEEQKSLQNAHVKTTTTREDEGASRSSDSDRPKHAQAAGSASDDDASTASHMTAKITADTQPKAGAPGGSEEQGHDAAKSALHAGRDSSVREAAERLSAAQEAFLSADDALQRLEHESSAPPPTHDWKIILAKAGMEKDNIPDAGSEPSLATRLARAKSLVEERKKELADAVHAQWEVEQADSD